mgnify:CR=1 FL=1
MGALAPFLFAFCFATAVFCGGKYERKNQIGIYSIQTASEKRARVAYRIVCNVGVCNEHPCKQKH